MHNRDNDWFFILGEKVKDLIESMNNLPQWCKWIIPVTCAVGAYQITDRVCNCVDKNIDIITERRYSFKKDHNGFSFAPNDENKLSQDKINNVVEGEFSDDDPDTTEGESYSVPIH